MAAMAGEEKSRGQGIRQAESGDERSIPGGLGEILSAVADRDEDCPDHI